jgi:hypothetical protein
LQTILQARIGVVNPNDYSVIAEKVRDRFHEHTKYWVTLTKTAVATGEETILVPGAPPPMGAS